MGPVSFTVDDADSGPDGLTIVADSSNPALAPSSRLVLGGSGGTRTLTIHPLAEMSGSTLITVIVSDGMVTAQDTFILTVRNVDDTPTLSPIDNQEVQAGKSSGPLAVTVNDVDTPLNQLTLDATAAVTTLLPSSSFVLGGSGATRTVEIHPPAGVEGTTAVTVTVSDGNSSAHVNFNVQVVPTNQQPYLSPINDQSVDEDTTLEVSFLATDKETASDELGYLAASSNQSLVPNANLVLSGSGTNRKLTIVPKQDRHGEADITIIVDDGELSTSRTFKLTVNPVDDPPTIEDIPSQTLNEDTVLEVPYVVRDVDTSAEQMTISASSTNTALLPNPNIVIGRDGYNGTFTITPAPDQSGEAIVIVTVSDGTHFTTDSFLVKVLPINDLPQVVPFENQSTLEDKNFGPFSFVIQDVETPATELTVTASSSNTALVPDANILVTGSGSVRMLSINPTADAFGTTMITLEVNDGEGTGHYQFRFTVEPVNDRPAVSAIEDVTTPEDTPVTVSFVASDVETAATQLSYTATSSNPTLLPQGSTLFGNTVNGNRLTLTPAANVHGTAIVTVTVRDGSLAASTSFKLTVTPVNDPPTLSSIQDVSTPEGVEITVNFTVNDVDNDLANLGFSFGASNTVLLPAGSIHMAGEDSDRILTLTPAPGVYGKSTITVQVRDGAASATSQFVLTVTARPTISPIPEQTTGEDEELTVLLAIDDRDTPLEKLQLSAESSNTQLIPKKNLSFGGTGNEPTLRIIPAADLSGFSQITVTVSDGSLKASTSFRLNVAPVDDAPIVDAIGDQIVDQDGSLTHTFKVWDGDTAPEQISFIAQSSNPTLVPPGNIEINGTGSNRTLTVTPAAGRSGAATITLVADDGANRTSVHFVLKVNGPPDLGAIDDVTMVEDGTKTVSFTVTDPDDDPATLVVTAVSSNATLLPNNALTLTQDGAGRTLALTPNADLAGTAVITLMVSDGRLTNSSAFMVTVLPENDPPAVGAIPAQRIDEDTISGPVPLTVSDPDTDLNTLKLFGTSSNTVLVPHGNIVFGGAGANRTVTITPSPNLSGSARITVTVSDGSLIATTTYTLTVVPVNDAPVLAPIPHLETMEDVPVTTTITLDDIDSPADSITLSGQSNHPQLVDSAGLVFSGSGKQRLLTITPQKDQAGVAALTILASDGSLTAATTFTLTVLNINDGPTLDAIPDQMMDEDSMLAVPLILRDIDTPPQKLELQLTSSDTRLFPSSTMVVEGTGYERKLRLQPTHNRNGAARITVTVDDGALAFDQTFLVTVRPVNDPPDAQDDTYTVITVPEISFGVMANDTDVDRDALSVVSTSQGRVGHVSINPDNTIRYRMPPNFTGQDIFTYVVSDGRGGEDTATVTVNVVEPPGPNTPEIYTVEPPAGLNDRSVEVTISGINFEEGASVHIGPFPLSGIRVMPSTDPGHSATIKALVPAFLPPARYDVIVANPDGRTAVRTGAYLVDTDKIALISVRPNRGQIELPVHINIYGLNFDPEAVALLDEKPLATTFVKPTHLQAIVPPGFAAPGRHAMTVLNPDGQKYTVADVYTVYTAQSDDLFALPYEMWTAPATLHTGQSVQLGLHVRRQVGSQVLTQVEVDFYVNVPYEEDTFVGRALVPLLGPGDDANSGDVMWTPPGAGSYTIYAVIDPRNRVAETDETNNLIKHTVTVLPTSVDMDAPQIKELTVNEGAPTTQSTAISITVRAADAAHPIRAVYLVEYEYIRGADQWVPVQWSDWLNYAETPSHYSWTLLSSPGIKYIQAWAADEAGNVMSQPALAAINYAPPEEDWVEVEQVRLYRYILRAGDHLSAFLMPSVGDPDLYVWPPDFQTRAPWITNLSSGVDEVGFVAPLDGTYQLEISGYTDARYRAAVELHSLGTRSADAGRNNLDPNKPRRAAPYIPVFDMPAAEYRLPSSPPAHPVVEPPPPPRQWLFLPYLNVLSSLQAGSAQSEAVVEPAPVAGEIEPERIFLPTTVR